MSRFNVGDRVRVRSLVGSDEEYGIRIGQEYTVTSIRSDGTAYIDAPEGRNMPMADIQLGLVSPAWSTAGIVYIEALTNKPKKSLMTQISNVAKKLLDADTQALIKAGYLDSDLDLTSKGVSELQAIQFQANKAELVALAKAELEEKK